MKVLYGTTNDAKVAHMRYMLEGLPIEVVGLNDLELETIDVLEDGETPLDNAIRKAEAYFRAFKLPVFACDSGLYIDGFRDDQQPKVNVRRVHGKKMDDDEMILHYSGLAQNNGGELLAWYENAICLVNEEGHMSAHQGRDLASERFIISDRPYHKRREGFPLDALSIQVKTGKYYVEDDTFREDAEMAEGFRRFFIKEFNLHEESLKTHKSV